MCFPTAKCVKVWARERSSADELLAMQPGRPELDKTLVRRWAWFSVLVIPVLIDRNRQIADTCSLANLP